MSPTTKYVVKCVLAGVYAALTYLAASQVAGQLTWDSLAGAAIAGGIAGLVSAGIGAGTTLEAPGKKDGT
jgi:hypothetical protein